MTSSIKKSLIIASFMLLNISSQAQTWIDSIGVYGREVFLPADKYKWDWGQATLLNSAVHLYRFPDNKDKTEYLNYIKISMDRTMGDANGKHPNAVASGHGMAFLAGVTKDPKYMAKANAIYEDFLLTPRTSMGAVSHRVESVELWDDTIYMLGMFFMEMYRQTGDIIYVDHFIHQLLTHRDALADKQTGLWVHGWDADNVNYQDRCSQKEWWNLSPERRSREFWGRGNGWVMMAIADALKTVPREAEQWNVLAKELKVITKILPELQDKESGMWYQLPVRTTEPNNFLESSCTAMFGYAITVGVKLGVLPSAKFEPVAERAYNGLHKNATVKIDDKYLAPSKVCLGTCIGDMEYYFLRRQGEGVNYAIGSYVMFGLEYETLKGLR